MKKALVFTSLLVVFFLFLHSQSVYAVIIKGEADFGQGLTIDWIVSDHDLASITPNADFIFVQGTNYLGRGNKSLYDTSQWYYYYQIENVTVSNLSTLSLCCLNCTAVISSGYIKDADLDDPNTFDHNGTLILGAPDVELASAVNGSTLTNPTGHDFDANPTDPNATWNFQNNIDRHNFSTVLFLTASSPLQFEPAWMVNGRFYFGSLPTPTEAANNTIPEPTTFLLISCAVCAVLKKQLHQT